MMFNGGRYQDTLASAWSRAFLKTSMVPKSHVVGQIGNQMGYSGEGFSGQGRIGTSVPVNH